MLGEKALARPDVAGLPVAREGLAVDGNGRLAVFDGDRHGAVDVPLAIEVAALEGGFSFVGVVERPADFLRAITPAVPGTDEVDDVNRQAVVQGPDGVVGGERVRARPAVDGV